MASPIYFKNLDGLRFIAAMFVIIGHCQAILFDSDLHLRIFSPWGEKMAGFGVDFFFVLSGFLISFLLIQELESTQTINIRRFYYRRILRLWPLYFIVGIFGLLFAEPILRWFGHVDRAPTAIEWIANFGYLFGFGINIQTLLGHMNPFSSEMLGHFWSLAVEEQFYLIWAPLLLFFRRQTLSFLLVMIGIGFFTSLYPPAILSEWFAPNKEWISLFFTTCRFFHFGLGALLAWSVQKDKLMDLPRFVSQVLQVAFIIPTITYLLGAYYYAIEQERLLNGLLSSGIIMMAFAKNSLFPLEFKWIKYFGKISFGIYIFHIIAIHIAYKWLIDSQINIHYPNYFVGSFLGIATIISLILATLSYECIEKYFLKLKK